MLMRKINAWISLLSTILLLVHAIFNAIRMLSGENIGAATDYTPWILTGLMLMHAFISIDFAISAHMGIEKRKCKNYPKMNVSAIIQRATGVLMLPFTALHIAGTTGFLQPPEIIHAILPLLFFGMVLAHAAVSTGKALITLGIGNAKIFKTVDITVKVLCAATWIVSVVAFNLYYRWRWKT